MNIGFFLSAKVGQSSNNLSQLNNGKPGNQHRSKEFFRTFYPGILNKHRLSNKRSLGMFQKIDKQSL